MKKIIGALFAFLFSLSVNAQDNVYVKINVIEGATASLTLMRDSIELKSSVFSDDLFDRPIEPSYDYIGAGWVWVRVFEFELPLTSELDSFVAFKVSFDDPEQTIIG